MPQFSVWVVRMLYPCDELATCPGCTLPSPNVSLDKLQPQGDHLNMGNVVEDELMDCLYMLMQTQIRIYSPIQN